MQTKNAFNAKREGDDCVQVMRLDGSQMLYVWFVFTTTANNNINIIAVTQVCWAHSKRLRKRRNSRFCLFLHFFSLCSENMPAHSEGKLN